MSNLIGCDYTCQRKKNINKLKDIYESGLTKYYSAYNQYLQHKYDRSNNKAWKRMYAEKTLRPKVEKLNNYLNGILSNMKKNISGSSGMINSQSNKLILLVIKLIRKTTKLNNKMKIFQEQILN